MSYIKHLFSTLALLAVMLFQQAHAIDNSKIIAKFNNENITLSDLQTVGGMALYNAEKGLYQQQVSSLKKLLISKVIQNDKRNNNLSDAEFINRFIAKPSAITDTQIQQFAASQQIATNKITAPIKAEIERYLTNMALTQQVEQWFLTQIKKNNILNLLQPPVEPTLSIPLGDSAYLGNQKAAITIVEFSDFECPFCAQASPLGNQLEKKYGEKINFVFKQFPLSIHLNAQKAAEASLCAKEQGNDYFWAMHDEMFAQQSKLNLKGLNKIAKEIKLNTAQFSQCLTSGKMKERVEQELNQGVEIGVRSTPTFFVNGHQYAGERTLKGFSQLIDQLMNIDHNK